MPSFRSRVGPSRTAALIAATVLGAAVVSCRPAAPAGPTETVVAASDYAFQSPAHLPSGARTFRLKNVGKVAHEVAMGQLRQGITADSVLARIATGGDPGDLTDGVVGVLIAGPGETSLGRLTVDLVPGRTYMMICQFKDADSLPPHVAMGMQASFVVD